MTKVIPPEGTTVIGLPDQTIQCSPGEPIDLEDGLATQLIKHHGFMPADSTKPPEVEKEQATDEQEAS